MIYKRLHCNYSEFLFAVNGLMIDSIVGIRGVNYTILYYITNMLYLRACYISNMRNILDFMLFSLDNPLYFMSYGECGGFFDKENDHVGCLHYGWRIHRKRETQCMVQKQQIRIQLVMMMLYVTVMI